MKDILRWALRWLWASPDATFIKAADVEIRLTATNDVEIRLTAAGDVNLRALASADVEV